MMGIHAAYVSFISAFLAYFLDKIIVREVYAKYTSNLVGKNLTSDISPNRFF